MSEPKQDSPNEATASRYWAFLSYSHRDAEWAIWLQRRLETYRIPRSLVGSSIGGQFIPQRLSPVFRDRDELPSAANLSAKIREALRESRALIIICSPWAAQSRWVNEEIRAYQALGRIDRILALIVEGEPGSADRECFPPALVEPFEAGGKRMEPLAADARKSGDGRANAVLKLVAGVLGISFDDLKRREKRRRHRIVALRTAAASLVWVGALVGYTLLADANINVPQGVAIRRVLDRSGITVFRRVASLGEIRQSAQESRRLARRFTVGSTAPAGNIAQSQPFSFWLAGQVIAPLYRDPDAGAADRKDLLSLMDHINGADFEKITSAVQKGDGTIDVDRGEQMCWMLLALAAAAQYDNSSASTRAQRALDLDRVESLAEAFHPNPRGGWLVVSRQSDKADYSMYDTALYLDALSEMKAAGLCWHDDCGRHQVLVAGTTAWLVNTFVDLKEGSGWGRTADDDKGPNAMITLMVYGALGAAQSVAGVKLPERIQKAALRDLAALSKRDYQPSNEEDTQYSNYADRQGRPGPRVAMISRLMWYPWAIHALYYWCREAERKDWPVETRLALMRAFGHVMIDLSKDLREEMRNPKTADFAIAETYYGLTFVP